jgi:hypothetical protein
LMFGSPKHTDTEPSYDRLDSYDRLYRRSFDS